MFCYVFRPVSAGSVNLNFRSKDVQGFSRLTTRSFFLSSYFHKEKQWTSLLTVQNEQLVHLKTFSDAMATSRSAIFDTPLSPMREHQDLPFTHCTFLGRHHLTFKDRMHQKPQSLGEGRFSFFWLQNSKQKWFIKNHYLLVRIILYGCFHSRGTRRSASRGESPLSFRFSILNQVYEPFLPPVMPKFSFCPRFSCLQTSER